MIDISDAKFYMGHYAFLIKGKRFYRSKEEILWKV